MGWMDDLFGAEDPYAGAEDVLKDFESTLLKYFQPFIDQTFTSLPPLEEQINMLTKNPNALWDMMASGFQESPGYQYQVDQGINAANQAAAAGGMLGTQSHQQQAMTNATNVANQGFNDYMGNMMGLYSQGFGGLKDLNNLKYSTGYNASATMGDAMGQMLGAKSNMAAQSAQSSNNNLYSMLGSAAYGGLKGLKII